MKNEILPRFPEPKGAVHVDYVLAIGMFLVTFAFVVAYTTDYYSTVKETASSMEKRSEAISLLSMAEHSPEPENWPELASNGTVLLMHLNNNTLDYSSFGNNGTLFNGANCSTSVAGRFFSACNFDGINDHINLGDYRPITDSFAISAWIKPTSFNVAESSGNILSKLGPPGTHSHTIRLADGGYINFALNNGDGKNLNSDNNTVPLNAWTHVAAVYNAAFNATNGSMSIYINGVLNKTSFISNGSIQYGATDMMIGALDRTDAQDYEQFFNGTIDEVAVFNRSLSAAEISELYRQPLRRIGLHSHAYRFYIKINNSVEYRITPAVNDTDIGNELVSFNLTEIFGAADMFSVTIYDENETTIPYYVNGTNITFAANVSANVMRWYTVYFDDDSIFPDLSTPVSGVNNLTETITGYERIDVLQYEKIRQLNSSDYSSVKNTSDIESNFNVQVYDTLTNATFEDFGGTPPGKGDIIALERFAAFQNSTAGVRQGKIIVKVW